MSTPALPNNSSNTNKGSLTPNESLPKISQQDILPKEGKIPSSDAVLSPAIDILKSHTVTPENRESSMKAISLESKRNADLLANLDRLATAINTINSLKAADTQGKTIEIGVADWLKIKTDAESQRDVIQKYVTELYAKKQTLDNQHQTKMAALNDVRATIQAARVKATQIKPAIDKFVVVDPTSSGTKYQTLSLDEIFQRLQKGHKEVDVYHQEEQRNLTDTEKQDLLHQINSHNDTVREIQTLQGQENDHLAELNDIHEDRHGISEEITAHENALNTLQDILQLMQEEISHLQQILADKMAEKKSEPTAETQTHQPGLSSAAHTSKAEKTEDRNPLVNISIVTDWVKNAMKHFQEITQMLRKKSKKIEEEKEEENKLKIDRANEKYDEHQIQIEGDNKAFDLQKDLNKQDERKTTD